ncbi:alanine racemase [Phyllobacterium salinisoli]|uniref:Alanine racemase n=1 Tax=Phyllobacterium salinisoli TaxID=1899321 RepID=A0A368K3Y4_9HYPH|nr:alanine racemase [Phyllobacterium salinisoli]RCS23183.1 alanine racemase [Phyllobacterium salinisoli]
MNAKSRLTPTSLEQSVLPTGADRLLAGGRLTIDLDALADNWRSLDARSRPGRAAAVVKADAYGCGIAQVVPALTAAGCDSFFVALPEEGLRVRHAAPRARVFVLNGLFDDAAPAFTDADLIPVLGSDHEIAIWAKHGRRKPCAIHVDTGMNRLGLSPGEAIAFAGSAKSVRPVLLMSHLACADTPSSDKSRQQLESFQKVRAAFGDIESSLANSAGIFLGSDYAFDLTRPGIALYGGEAVDGTGSPMKQVVTAETRIVQIRHAAKGETAGYGATTTLARDTRIAVCSTGYADGYPRAASGSGIPLRSTIAEGAHGFIAGQRVPVLGRVTMDLTSFDVTDVPEDAIGIGDHIELFGANIALDDVARAAGTIGYELLTGLGLRYHRRYIGGELVF